MKGSSFVLFLFSLTLITCFDNIVSGNQGVCAGMFTTGILKADSSTLSSSSNSEDLEPYKAIVNTSRAWCADSSDIYQYLQVNFGRLRNITSIGIQGYKPGFVAYVSKFVLTYTTDDVSWNYYKDDSNSIKIFINSPVDDNEVITHQLNTSPALRIRIKPQEWHNWICMRIELFTCDPVDGGFSEWSTWSECNNAIQSRSRVCDSPYPARGGLNCTGNYSIIRSCTKNVTANITDTTTADNIPLQDPCVPNPCQNATSCISFMNISRFEYSCNCTEGFSGKNCTLYDSFEFLEFIPSQEMHAYQNVVLPVAVSVASSAFISGSFGVIYFIVKAKFSKIAPTRSVVV